MGRVRLSFSDLNKGTLKLQAGKQGSLRSESFWMLIATDSIFLVTVATKARRAKVKVKRIESTME